MIADLQRVAQARVQVRDEIVGEIGRGLLVLLCAVKGDTESDADYLAKKVVQLRVFGDGDGKMNCSVADVAGGVLVVSQFTLAASVRRGNRPSFSDAEAPERARDLYERVITRLRESGIPVATGTFAETMQISLVNDGPVTIIADSRE